MGREMYDANNSCPPPPYTHACLSDDGAHNICVVSADAYSSCIHQYEWGSSSRRLQLTARLVSACGPRLVAW